MSDQPWHTTNIRLATHLALLGIWPTRIVNRNSSDHLSLIYEERPPQMYLDSFLSGEDKGVNKVLDIYHGIHVQMQQAKDLQVDGVAFRMP